MIRFGLGILVATTACAAVGVAACGDTIKDAGSGPGNGGSGNTGGGAGSESGGSGNGGGSVGGGSGLTFPTSCQGACCPTDATCYAGPNKGENAGGECMATHKNDLSADAHIQMRQAWIRALTPIGNTQATVYNVLAGRTELPAKNCNQGQSPLGSGGYMQLIDFYLGGSKATPGDVSKDYSMVGYAVQVTAANLQDNLTNGFCMGTDATYPGDAKYRLPTTAMSPSTDYPVGLPHPMGLATAPWTVGPTKAKRLKDDFGDLKSGTTRKDLLAKLDKTTGEYGMAGYDGVFFYNDATGYAHGYGSMGWTIVYALDGKSHLSIPIREVETKSTFNDPKNPNCVGEYRGEALDPGSSCSSSSQDDPAWGGGNCGDHKCDPGKKDAAGKPAPEAPATTEGYFLITELQQIFSPDLSATLCVTYPTAAQMTTEGFYDATTFGCVTPKWDPTKADGTGIPMGDWCAATNSAATTPEAQALHCHDAWHSRSNHVFIGGKIKVPAVPSDPMTTCSFQ